MPCVKAVLHPGPDVSRVHTTGRNFLRCVEGRKNSNLNITVINDSGASAGGSWYMHAGTTRCILLRGSLRMQVV